MVKSNAPLQIRLTEPVIFLKGPSTGLDFRGRPQQIGADAQPAQLRGLLTLRLSKPTRVRRVEIKLEGKARTEWPEGIGSRRSDTSEEQTICYDSTTYFNAYDHKDTVAAARRSASVGPGVSGSFWDMGYDEAAVDDVEVIDSPMEDGIPDDWTHIERRGRGEGRTMPRSASAVPGEFGDGRSRWASSGGAESGPQIADQSIQDRGPTPAYSFRPEPMSSAESSRRGSMLAGPPTLPPRDHTLSPIASAPTSRGTSDRDGSTSTERRRSEHSRLRRTRLSESALDDQGVEEEENVDSAAGEDTVTQPLDEFVPLPIRPSILESSGQRHPSGEVRFATAPIETPEPPSEEKQSEEKQPEQGAAGRPETRTTRAASIISTNSQLSTSTASLHGRYNPNELHPVSSAILTAHNTPAPSAAPSIREYPSVENLPSQTRDDQARATLRTEGEPTSSADTSARNSINTSRRSSLRDQTSSGQSGQSEPTSPLPASSQSPVPSQTQADVRQGRRSRLGSASTIITNNEQPPVPTRPPSLVEQRQNSDSSRRSASGSFSTASGQIGHKSSSTALRDQSPDTRSRQSKFSLSSAFGAVKERMSSKSRNRAGSRVPRSRATSFNSEAPPLPSGTSSASMSRTGSGTGTPKPLGSALPTHMRDEDIVRGRDGRARSTDGSVAPFGRGGAARDSSRSRDRTISPSRRDTDSPHRGRGRNKGIKGLTDVLLGDHHHEEEGEDVHNWKEFRKGTYNYPISFAIPPDAPPTLHAEFGSVTYRLKATVVRVGALTPNMVEEVEVIMIASPQEDDLEETENVIVERQWEEQMRYQISLSGKAFPIGGIIPISVRLMPLLKCKIHRLTVALEEKTDYYAQERKVTRHETPRKFVLLFIKQPERFERVYPLLPIISDDPNAAKDSPLAPLAAQAAANNPSPDNFDPGNEDSMYASLLDPMGPWQLEKTLQLPDCTSLIKFTNKHEKTNITVSHWLKVTIRVERGDDVAVDSKGRRKQFDIIIETPIKILDCRVNPQWNSLPTYSPNNPGSLAATPGVCSVHGNPRNQTPITSSRSANPDSLVSAAPTSRATGPSSIRESSRGRSRDANHNHHHHHEHEDTLLERNIVYDRLVSGQQTETGELPPTYGEAVAMAITSASRSPSTTGRERSLLHEDSLRSGSNSRSRSRMRESLSR